jgi:hypothetical protein
MNAPGVVQLRPKLSTKAKQYLVFVKLVEKYGQKAGFEKNVLTYFFGIKF